MLLGWWRAWRRRCLALGLAAWRRGRGLLAGRRVGLLVAAAIVAWGTYVNLGHGLCPGGRLGAPGAAALAERSERAALLYLAPTYQVPLGQRRQVCLPTWGTYEEEPTRGRDAGAPGGAGGRRGGGVGGVGVRAGATRERHRALAGLHGFRQSERWYGPFRLASYRTGSALAAGFSPLEARFGEGIRLLGYSPGGAGARLASRARR